MRADGSTGFRLAASIALLAFAGGAQAQQTGAVTGNVVDAITGLPIADVSVSVVGSEAIAGTDDQGTYQLGSIAPGLIRVSAQIIGYNPITTPYYTLLPDSSITVHFRLAPLSVALEPVEVTAERLETPHHLGSTVITRDQLPARGDVLQALQGAVPGVRLTGRQDQTRTRIRHSMSDALYVINGTVVTPPLTFYIDVGDVECVEIRRGFQAASEFRPSINGETYSGVILIWTRGALGARPAACRDDNG
jgi:hypothetical protein